MSSSNAEKSTSVDQGDPRLARAVGYINQHPALFAQQGAVVATWRVENGHRYGPYFRLAFRELGRQRSIYLGASPAVAEEVRRILARLHRGRDERRVIRRLTAQVRKGLRAAKAEWNDQLRVLGLHLKGFEIRGGRSRSLRFLFDSVQREPALAILGLARPAAHKIE